MVRLFAILIPALLAAAFLTAFLFVPVETNITDIDFHTIFDQREFRSLERGSSLIALGQMVRIERSGQVYHIRADIWSANRLAKDEMARFEKYPGRNPRKKTIGENAVYAERNFGPILCFQRGNVFIEIRPTPGNLRLPPAEMEARVEKLGLDIDTALSIKGAGVETRPISAFDLLVTVFKSKWIELERQKRKAP